jgi:hypothetical protein
VTTAIAPFARVAFENLAIDHRACERLHAGDAAGLLRLGKWHSFDGPFLR